MGRMRKWGRGAKTVSTTYFFNGSIMAPLKLFFLKICICHSFLVCVYMKDTSVSLDKSIPCLSLLEGLLPVSWIISFAPLYWITSSICIATHAVISLLHFLLFFIAKILERLVHTAVSNSPHLLFECIAVRLSLACLQLYYSVKIAVTSLLLNLMANSVFTLLHPLSVSKLALFTTPSFKTLLSLAPGPTFSWFKLFLHLWYQFFLMFQSLKEVAQDSVLGLSFPAVYQVLRWTDPGLAVKSHFCAGSSSPDPLSDLQKGQQTACSTSPLYV